MDWYEELDFYDNPLTTNPDDFIEGLIGVDDLQKELFYRVESGSMVFVEGAAGLGKTAVLRKVIRQFSGKKKIIYFDCRQVNELDIEKLMRARYGLLGKLFNAAPKGMIVLLDNASFLSRKNAEKIKHYFDYGYIRSVVFTGERYSKSSLPASVKERIGKKLLLLRRLAEDEAVELVKHRLEGMPVVSDELIKKVFKRSLKNTKKFIENCEKVCENAVNEKRKEASEEDLKVIK